MKKETIVPEGTEAGLLWSPGIRIGNLLYLSGVVGADRESKVSGPDIESQARQALMNLGEVLEAAGSSWDKVMKANCFLSHVSRDFAGWNKVWKEYFPKDPPARTTVGTKLLNDAWLIELDLVAIAE